MVTAGMTPRDAVRQLEARLTAAGCPDADYDAAELFRLVTGRDVRLADAPLTEAQAARLESLCLRREAREPLQYLCGHWSFLDFELIVGPGVLCPRADTEVVAEAAAQTLAGVKAPRVLDLCAGTGCLGLGVKRFCPDAQVTCVEKSPEAFRYLEQNVRTALPGAAPAVQAVQGDMFTYWQSLPEGQLDLRPGGALVLEIGWQQRQAVMELLAGNGWADIECRRDYGGNDRCIIAHRPK